MRSSVDLSLVIESGEEELEVVSMIAEVYGVFWSETNRFEGGHPVFNFNGKKARIDRLLKDYEEGNEVL